MQKTGEDSATGIGSNGPMRRYLPILMLVASVAALAWGTIRFTDGPIRIGGGVELSKVEPPEPPDPGDIEGLRTGADPIGGRILSPDRRPVLDARVEVLFQQGADWLGALKGLPLVVRKTDADGRFSLPEAEPGSYGFRVSAEGLGESIAILPGFTEGQVQRVTITLPALVSIGGRAEDRRGRPVPGATVIISPARVITDFLRLAPEFSEIRLPQAVRVVTDEDGAFLAENLAPLTFDLEVTAPGMVKANVYTVTPPVSGLLVPMMEGLTVTGTVTWGEGPAPEGLRVFTEPEGLAAEVEIAKTAATFELQGLPPGVHSIHAWARSVGAASQDVSLKPGEKTPAVDLELLAGTPVSGRVTELYSGQPIPVASVTLSEVLVVRGKTTVVDRDTFQTGPDGKFAFHPPPGRWVLRAQAKDHLPIERTSSPRGADDAGEPFDIAPGEVEVRRDLVLRGNYVIRGRVLYPDGRPAMAWVSTAGAELLPGETDRKRAIPRGRGMQTNHDGYFRIEGVAPFASYKVRAAWDRENFDVVEGVTFKAGSRRTAAPALTILAPPPPEPVREPAVSENEEPVLAVATGRVVTSRREPVPGALVSVRHQLAHTDGAGRFRVPDLRAGTYRVRVFAPSALPATLRRFTMKEGVDQDLGDVMLPDRGVRVMGSVHMADLTPVPDVRLRVTFANQQEPYELFTDARGRYEIEGPAVETTSVTVETRAPGHEVLRLLEQVVDTRVIDIELKPLIPVTVRIDGAKTPLPTLMLEFRPGRHTSGLEGFVRRMSPTGKNDTWVVRGVPAGTYEIVLRGAGYAPLELGQHRLSIAAGHDLGRHTLSRGGAVVGVVTDHTGQPVSGATVYFRDLPERKMITRADGKFSFENVPVGSRTFLAYGPERRVRPLCGSGKAKVREGKTAEVEIRLR